MKRMFRYSFFVQKKGMRLIGSCLLLFFLSHALTGNALQAETYPLPITELESVVTHWFEKKGYVITRSASQNGSLELRSVNEMKTCLTRLKPRSAVAAEVDVTCLEGGDPEHSFKYDLFEFLNAYVSWAGTHQTALPSAVMSKAKTVVCVRAIVNKQSVQFSGFLVDKDGLILSTAHDVGYESRVLVVLHDGRELPGTVVKSDLVRDLALIDIEANFCDFISFETSRNLLGFGEPIYSIGCPLSLGGTVYPGTINGPPRLVNGQPLWQVTLEIHHGSSGSPVFDGQGNLVAVVKGRMRGTESIGFLIPIETIIAFSQDMEP
jgi:serine protease Do